MTTRGPMSDTAATELFRFPPASAISAEGDPEARKGGHWLDQTVFLLVGALMLLLGGVWADHWRAQGAEAELRRQLLAEAVALARTLNRERLGALSFDVSDMGAPAYERLRGQLMAYREVSGVRGIYTLARRGDSLVFGPESYGLADPQHSPPGTPYLEPPDALMEAFAHGRAMTAGPYEDEYGRFVSAFVPLPHPQMGEVLHVLGVDVEAKAWSDEIHRSRATVWVAVFSLMAIVLGGWSVVLSRDRVSPAQRRGLRNVEVWLVVVFGLATTLIASLTLHAIESRAQHVQFALLAESVALRVNDEFHALRDHQFQALVDTVEQLPAVDEHAFRRVTRSLLAKGHVIGVGWAPRVDAAELAAFEARVRAEGLARFQVFDLGPDGTAQPLAARDAHFPLRFVEPESFHPLIGFDLLSEPKREAALGAVRKTGLKTATGLVPTGDAAADVVFVYAAVPRPEPQATVGHPSEEFATRGVLVLALRIDALLQSTVAMEHTVQAPVAVDLYQISPGQPPGHLAASATHGGSDDGGGFSGRWPNADRFAVTQPLLVFGKALALRIYATSEYRSANPLRIGWSTALLGALLTLLSATLVQFLIHRRMRLEQKVQARTAELSQSESRYRQVVDNIREVAFQMDCEGRLAFLNNAWEGVTAFPVEESLGSRLADYAHAEDRAALQELLEGLFQQRDEHSRGEFRCLCRDGSFRWLEITVRAGWDGQGRPTGAFGTLEDVTDRRNKEQEIRVLAFHDALTGLPNRRLLLDRLQRAMVASRRDGFHGALLFLDLDHFKQLNDTLGHDQGDVLLREIARRLRDQVRDSDTVARFGGDEFVVIVAPLSPDVHAAKEQAARIAEKVRRAVSQPVPLRDQDYCVTPSIGVKLFVGTDFTVPELLRGADEAMYDAKAAGRNRIIVAGPELDTQV